MSRFQEKLKVVKEAKANVKDLRRALTLKRLELQCKERNSDKRVAVNENFFDAHEGMQNYAMPMPCMILQDYEYCPNITCPNIEWNKQYVDLNIQLRDAKHERNQAILDLFHLKEKVADIKEYRRLKKLKEQQSKEVLHLTVEYSIVTLDDHDEYHKVRQEYENAVEEYKKIARECDAERRKIWRRSK